MLRVGLRYASCAFAFSVDHNLELFPTEDEGVEVGFGISSADRRLTLEMVLDNLTIVLVFVLR